VDPPLQNKGILHDKNKGIFHSKTTLQIFLAKVK